MLHIYESPKSLNFCELASVYKESICSSREQFAIAQQDFYDCVYDFFSVKGAMYAVWEEDGHFQASLRIEPYHDGVIVTGLETKPEVRRKGYATKLLSQVIAHLKAHGAQKVYSHVDKRNIASMLVHTRCGFQQISDHAVFLDGSVSYRSETLCAHIK